MKGDFGSRSHGDWRVELLEQPLLFLSAMEYQGELRSQGLSFRGLHAVLAHLNNHPDRTHLLALRGPNGVQDFIVTPKRRTQAVAQLRRIVNNHAKRNGHEIRIQTF